MSSSVTDRFKLSFLFVLLFSFCLFFFCLFHSFTFCTRYSIFFLHFFKHITSKLGIRVMCCAGCSWFHYQNNSQLSLIVYSSMHCDLWNVGDLLFRQWSGCVFGAPLLHLSFTFGRTWFFARWILWLCCCVSNYQHFKLNNNAWNDKYIC